MHFHPPSRPPSGIGQKNVYGKGFISGALTEPQRGTSALSTRYSFMLIDATDDEGAKVLILDGEINEELPVGMGGDDYIVGVADGDDIYAVVTYDTDTFAITSRTIGVGSLPDDDFGTLNVRIGYVNVDTSGPTPVVTPHNTQCGDINASPRFTSINGVLSLEWFNIFGQPVAVS